MALDKTTIARPYAKAAFEYALANTVLKQWSDMLTLMANIVLDPRIIDLIDEPNISVDKITSIIIDICGNHIDEKGQNLIRLLAANRRLLVLADIKAIYENLRAEQEKTLNVEVFSFSALNKSQEQALIQSLKNRLQREISLKTTIDKTLIGGAVIRAGDLVIDGSVRGKLDKLSTEMIA